MPTDLPSPPKRQRAKPLIVARPKPPPAPPLPPGVVGHMKVRRAIEKLTRRMTPMQQRQEVVLLADDIVQRSAVLDAAVPLDERWERSAREYLDWCRAHGVEPVGYPAGG